MRRLSRPDVWFFVALLGVAAVAGALLARPTATRVGARELNYSRHYWQVGFDALSAACGVGLLSYDFSQAYTEQGRWILSATGVVGALLFLAAMTQAARRIAAAQGNGRLPHPLLVVAAFLLTGAVVGGGLLAGRWLGRWEAGTTDTVWAALASFASLGWATRVTEPGALPLWPLALAAWLSALGWPVWLLAVPPLARRYLNPASAPPGLMTGRLARRLTFYSLILVAAALLVCAFEAPRGEARTGPGRQRWQPPARQSSPQRPLSAEAWPTRFARSLVQVAAAAGAGAPTEPLAGPGGESPLAPVSGGTKVALGGLLLLGGLGGSATGGVQLPLLLGALSGTAAALGWRQRRPLGETSAAAAHSRWMIAGFACLLVLLGLALVVAAGLLLLENWTASRFQPPPTFADAFVDACSVVAGGNLSSGLTEAVTGRHLIRGIRQAVDLYPFGMAWLVLAMLAGRIVPLAILRRLGER